MEGEYSVFQEYKKRKKGEDNERRGEKRKQKKKRLGEWLREKVRRMEYEISTRERASVVGD